MSIQSIQIRNDQDLYCDIFTCNTLNAELGTFESLGVHNLNPKDFGGELNIGMGGLPSRVNIASAGTPVYINDLLYTPGSTGSIGPTGATGQPGIQGLIGPIGATGLNGSIGPIGATGLNGSIGPTGATGSAGIATVSPFSGVGNANGLDITGNAITLHAATNVTPGGVSTGVQTFNGIKTFPTGIIVSNPATPGINNVFSVYYEYLFSGAEQWQWSGGSNTNVSMRVTRIGNQLYINPNNALITNASAGTMTYTGILPLEFRPTNPLRGGMVYILENGNPLIGYFNVTQLGVIRVGSRTGYPSDVPLPIASSSPGIYSGIVDCVMSCSLS